MAPTLSIIVPTHDTRERTLGCLAAVTSWPPGDHEVILVDDGSVDGTGDAVRERYGGVRIVRRDRAGGFTKAANAGLHAAGGAVLFLLNSDAIAPPEAPAALLEAFRSLPRLGAAALPLVNEDGSPQWSAGRFPTPLWLFALASGIPAALARFPVYRLARGRRPAPDWVSGAALALRREAWLQVGDLDEAYTCYAQDLDYCTRLRAAGWDVALLDGPSVRHEGGATIGRKPGAVGSSHPGLLWSDLVLWSRKHRGPGAGAAASRALRRGALCRIVARRVAAPFVGVERREGFRTDTQAFEEARTALAPE